MVQRLLQLNGLPAPDSADALACAISHAHHSSVVGGLQKSGAITTGPRRRIRAGRILG
jgi:crossover junction endodeoxyribonuclease RuvC